jgi:23S rRNA (pseudouridine1915-N3)-methyltransferase
MLLKIIAVGKMKDRALSSHVQTYVTRLSPYAKVEIVEIRDGAPENEGAKILEQLDGEKGYVIVLSEEGVEVTSKEFSAKLMGIDRKIVLVIGGPYGLAEAVKKRGDWLLSLSRMTFTHEMARYLLLEQLYRAVMIGKGKNYHN